MNLATSLAEAAFEYAARPALLVDGDAVTYADLEARSAAAAADLRLRGVETGDRVALMLPNGAAFVAASSASLIDRELLRSIR